MFGFHEVWAVDFEFIARPGHRPEPVCLVAIELISGRKVRLWRDEMGSCPPYSCGPDSVVGAYFASAEWSCHLALGWPLPDNIIDFYAEFRNHTNGLTVPSGRGLIGAMRWFELDSMTVTEKTDMRDLILGGGPWSSSQKRQILDYCEKDVRALEMLAPKLERVVNVPEALLRGRYTKAVAHMEHTGTPIDTHTLARLDMHWDDIRAQLIRRIDRQYGVFDGLVFKLDRWADWLAAHDIPWQRLPSGELDLKDETFSENAKIYPEVAPMHQLRHALSQLKLNKLAVGPDGRNRTLISPFGQKSGRNNPSSAKSIFGPSAWLRSLIKPDPRRTLAYIDWSQQELGIAAALSGDSRMQQAYLSGDFYLTFAKQAGAAPEGATKQSHARERELFKTCSLGINYGMGPELMAQRIGEPTVKARELIRLHREAYREFWKWSDGAVHYFNLHQELWTVFGWQLYGEAREPVLRNFLMQANGSEMLRLACCYLTEAGIDVCTPIHDAVLVEGPSDEIADIVHYARQLMAKASRDILGGFELRTDVDMVRYPDRYRDKRGEIMWETIMELLEGVVTAATPSVVPRGTEVLYHGAHPVLL